MKHFTVITDVKIVGLQYGEEACASGHAFGPYIRDHWLIHYVRHGCGTFRIHGVNHAVGAGEVFFIPPDISTYYAADKEDPWEYVWLGIYGEGLDAVYTSVGLTDSNPVRRLPEAAVTVLERLLQKEESISTFEAIGEAYAFLDALTAAGGRTERSYVERAEEYIRQSLYKKRTVEEVAAHLNINRSYLTALFKQYRGMSTQRYMLRVKMETAARYLITTDYDVARIARSVGYEDVFVFSHAFKKEFGQSPTVFRQTRQTK